MMNGIIIKAISGFYYVSDGEKIYECKARGSFRESGVSPLVGDRVEFERTEEQKGIVTDVLPRKNLLSRPPVANIDKLFIISSYEKPAPNAYIIDRHGKRVATYVEIVTSVDKEFENSFDITKYKTRKHERDELTFEKIEKMINDERR